MSRISFVVCILSLALMMVGCGVPLGPVDSQTLSLRNQSSASSGQSLNIYNPHHDMGALKDVKALEQYPLTQFKASLTGALPKAAPMGVSTTRYLTIQLEFKKQMYELRTDLKSPTFQLEVRLLTLPLQLQCVPSTQKKRPSISTAPTGASQEKENVELLPMPNNDGQMAKFERDANELAGVVWVRMKQLWQVGHCALKGKCGSEIFSDITLDYTAGPQHSCRMVLVRSSR